MLALIIGENWINSNFSIIRDEKGFSQVFWQIICLVADSDAYDE